MPRLSFLALVLTLHTLDTLHASSPGEIMGRRVSKTLQILSPLQSFTIFPKEKESTTSSPREDFLPKFQSGLTAETKVKEQLARRRELTTIDSDGNDNEYAVGSAAWEKKMMEKERLREEKEEEIVDRTWDRATAKFEKSKSSPLSSSSSPSSSKYQFVGIIQPPNSEQKVKWFARKREKGSEWNIRMLHVNRDVIVRDLFTSGKIDIMGKYVNTGESLDEGTLKEGESPSLAPRIKGEYSVKLRKPWNLWNFSPKHFFTDSSGAFWRERRLSPGLYTDGKLVYESSYRYTDGKNGMKPISRLDALLKSKVIKKDIKLKVLKRLKEDAPDVVIEE
jgi:hypothetical protein